MFASAEQQWIKDCFVVDDHKTFNSRRSTPSQWLTNDLRVGRGDFTLSFVCFLWSWNSRNFIVLNNWINLLNHTSFVKTCLNNYLKKGTVVTEYSLFWSCFYSGRVVWNCSMFYLITMVTCKWESCTLKRLCDDVSSLKPALCNLRYMQVRYSVLVWCQGQMPVPAVLFFQGFFFVCYLIAWSLKPLALPVKSNYF